MENNALDASGNGNNGTIYGATFTNDKFGQSISFSTATDVVIIPQVTLGIGLGDFTVGARVRFTAYPVPGTSGLGVIAFEDYTPCIIIGRTTGTNLEMYWYQFLDFGAAVPFNTSSYIIIQRISGTAYGWIDGRLCPNYLNLSAFPMYDSRLAFGQSGVTYRGDPFTGTIDEVAIWNRALTQQDIRRVTMGMTPIA
jgi:hypothetical protein